MRTHCVSVLSVAPGPIATGFASRAGMNMRMSQGPDVVARIALASLGRRTTVRPGALSKFLGWSLAMLYDAMSEEGRRSGSCSARDHAQTRSFPFFSPNLPRAALGRRWCCRMRRTGSDPCGRPRSQSSGDFGRPRARARDLRGGCGDRARRARHRRRERLSRVPWGRKGGDAGRGSTVRAVRRPPGIARMRAVSAVSRKRHRRAWASMNPAPPVTRRR